MNVPTPVELLRSRLDNVRQNGRGFTARCPAHEDRENSLSVAEGDDGRALVKCFAGCNVEGIVEVLHLTMRDLFEPNVHAAHGTNGSRGRGEAEASVSGATVQPGITIAALAAAKRLPPEQLRAEYGLFDLPNYNGAKAVGIPYLDATGELAATRFRIALTGDRFRWKKGDTPTLYGLWRLAEMRKSSWVLIVEGESDCWTVWQYGLPALGVPGKGIWKPEWVPLFDGIDVYLWQEPDAEDFAIRVGTHLPALKVITAPADHKDVSAAHLAGAAVPALIERLRPTAVPVSTLLDKQRQERLAGTEQAAAAILTAEDPLPLIEEGIAALGYGGDLTPAVVTYLAATTRLLAVRPGTMLGHLLLIGPASAGKSYTVNVTLRLLPEDAYVVIDAGSPRVLIYDPSDLWHRLLIFGEADSIPAGEDNPAASAIRNLLQENRLVYKVTVRDPQSGEFVVKTVDKPGPTVMITTATRSLGHQLNTRIFSLDVPDDARQMRAALAAQAALEEGGGATPEPSLIAFQDYLQCHAPWDVVVPFVRQLADLIGQTQTASRVLRDFQRLLALIKAVAVLRHKHRQRSSEGRLIATIEDYLTVRELVNPLYEASISGASQRIRETVAAVQALIAEMPGAEPSATDVATKLGIHKTNATRRINKAIAEGWLVNKEERPRRPYRLALGEALPPVSGLPTEDQLIAAGCAVAPSTDG